MKPSKIALILALALTPALACAESFFQAEIGVGYGMSKGMGDGTWTQYGLPHGGSLNAPVLTAGLTGDIGSHLAWHVDYVYLGQISANCLCVTDAQYNTHTQKSTVPGYIPFNGFGHTNGIALTAAPFVTYGGARIAIEGGPFLFRDTWHVTHIDPAQPGNTRIDHPTTDQLGWVSGVYVSYKSFSVGYRYYATKQRWVPTPGMRTGTHSLVLTKEF